MAIRPTPWTAAAAGVVAAIAWPLLWHRFGGASAADGGALLVVLSLLSIALPAHLFVVGVAQAEPQARRTLDTALLVRIAAWIVAAVATTLLASAAGLTGTPLV